MATPEPRKGKDTVGSQAFKRQRSSLLLWSPKALRTTLLALACLVRTWRLSDKETHAADPFVPSKVSQAYMSALDNQLAWQSRDRLKENF